MNHLVKEGGIVAGGLQEGSLSIRREKLVRERREPGACSSKKTEKREAVLDYQLLPKGDIRTYTE